MNRYTTEDFEELGNIAAEICCEKKFNPFAFKKFAKKGAKKDDDEDGKSKGKPKSKEKGKRDKNEKVDEGYLVEFEENQGIPWEPINEKDGFYDYHDEPTVDTSTENDPQSELNNIYDPYEEPITPSVKNPETPRRPGEVEIPDIDEDDITSNNRIKRIKKHLGLISDRDLETENDFAYGSNQKDNEMLAQLAYNPFSKKPADSLDKAMDFAKNDVIPDTEIKEEPATDDSQANENGEGAEIESGSVEYPITLTFANGDKIEYDGKEYYDEDGNLVDNKFDFDEIVDNLKSEHSGEDGDSRIIKIGNMSADEWAKKHGIENLVPPETYEDDGENEDGEDGGEEGPPMPTPPAPQPPEPDEENNELDPYSF